MGMMWGSRSSESKDPWAWMLSWNLSGRLCICGVGTWCMVSSTGWCLAVFGRGMCSSPVDDLLTSAFSNRYPDDLRLAKLTSVDMKPFCDESADL